MASLVSIAEYKVWSGITGTAQDALLTVLVNAVSMEIRRWCDRDLINGFELTARTEYYNGSGEETIMLREWPVASVASVVIRYAGGQTETVDATTYRVDSESGVLSRIDAVRTRYGVTSFGNIDSIFAAEPRFPDGFGNIAVTYTGGYDIANIPPDLKMACYRLIDLAYSARGRNFALASESLGQYSYSNGNPQATNAIKADLMRAYNSSRS
ncbi:MAG: hypothetical protein EBZ40_11325 [Gammaproteobacteria bacterium]|nr:hypothetical protein [Gammaproteobacteria bacterium]